MQQHTLKRIFVTLVVGFAAAPVGQARAQFAQFLGPHVVETLALRGEVPGTGRIGGMTADRYGYLYVANQDEGVWKIHPDGRVELFVKGLYGSGGNAVMRNGDLLQASYDGNKIVRVERDGTVHPFASEGLNGPVGIAVVPNGDVFTVNYRSNYLSRITPDGAVSEFVRDDRFDGPNGITSDRDGNLYVVNLGNTIVFKVTPDAEISEIARLPGTANAHVVYAGGVLYVTQIWQHVVLRVQMDGSYDVVAGNGTRGFEDGPTGTSTTAYPNGITVWGNDIIFNTLRGDMIAGHIGVIDVRRMVIPNPVTAFTQVYEQGGLEAVRDKFDEAMNLGAPVGNLAPALYSVAKRFFDTGETEVGLALIEWTADVDDDQSRAHTQMGSYHGLYGDKGTAVEHLQRAVDLEPDNESLRLRLEGVKAYRR